MKKILREETAFNGNTVRLEVDTFDLGEMFKIKIRKVSDCGFRYNSAWETLQEANNYFNKLIRGGMR